MSPLVRRTWSPIAQTPVISQRTRAHKRLSAIAALCVSPERDAVRLYFRLHPDASIDSHLTVGFLRRLRRELGGGAVIVWDRLAVHRALIVRSCLSDAGLHAFFLPPYAPELNPVEYLWGWLKINPLANLAATDLTALADTTRCHTRSVQRKPELLRSFVEHSPLPLRLH